MTETHASESAPWKWSSVTSLLVALLVAFMLFLAARGFFQPVAAAKGFGLELLDARDDVFLRIKAGRDLGVGVMLLAVLAWRDRALAGWVVLVASVMPTVDGLVVATSARGSVAYALMVHGSAVVYGLVLGPLLLRGARSRR